MNIEANDLLLFAQIVDSGNFSRAAEQLGLPKSTVSRRITELENQVGERLLQRTTRKLVVTELGASLLEHARQLAIEVAAATAVVQYRQAVPSGRLRVSMPSDFACMFLSTHLAEFRQRYPAISLELDLSPRRVDIVNEKYDLAIRMGELADDATLVARRLAQFSVGIYAAPSYLALRGLPDHPDALLQHDTLSILSQTGLAPVWTLISNNQRWQGTPTAPIFANSPEFLIQLACNGLGIAVVPDRYAAPHLAKSALVRILPEWCLPSVSAWAVFPERRLLPAKTRVFLDLLDKALVDNPVSEKSGFQLGQ